MSNLDNLSKEQVIKILKVNNIPIDPNSDLKELKKIAKEKIINGGEKNKSEDKQSENKPAPTPAIHKQKDVEADEDTYRERLKDAGHEVLPDEEIERIDEEAAKRKEQMQLTSTQEIANQVMQQLLSAAGGAAGNLADKRSNELNKNSELLEIATAEELDFLARIKNEAKVTIAIPIERDPFNKKSVMPKQAMLKNKVPMLINGAPVLKDVIHVNLNGHTFTFDLGVDNGARSSVYIQNVPWSIAKVLARSLHQEIENTETGEVYTPPTLPNPPQYELDANGQIIQSEALQGIVLGSRG